jgi:hypothetical protein
VRFVQLLVPRGQARELAVVVVQHPQIGFVEILDVDQPVARPLDRRKPAR